MAKYTILDLDNCISDDEWRIPFINWHIEHDMTRRYHDYHSLCGFDNPAHHELWVNQGTMLNPNRVIIFTARPNACRAQTQVWLTRHKVNPTHLIMRNDNEHMSSAETKSQQLAWLFLHYNVSKEEIAIAYDDRQEVVDMYRAWGLQAEVRKIHDQCAYNKPQGKAK